MKTADISIVGETPTPLAAEGGVTLPTPSGKEPYEALDDLMVAVEALCPRWPSRGIFDSRGDWRL